ncbi:MAG: hypothetical protein HQ546_05150 [Planctomycetes bacterium]|nr:hypothetical protein [Planctomycetota bacterium]
MSSFLLPSSMKAKRLNLGGSGDPKDKMMITILVVIIIGAVVALVMTFIGSGDSKITSEYHLLCVNPSCEHEWTWSRSKMIELQKEKAATAKPKDAPAGLRILFTEFPSFECPQCGQKTGYRADQCPSCEKWYLPAALKNSLAIGAPPMGGGGGQKCPHCGVDIGQWLAEHPEKK